MNGHGCPGDDLFYFCLQMIADLMGLFDMAVGRHHQVHVDQICILVMNKDQNMDFSFDIILNKNGKSKKALVVNADASLDKIISGLVEKQSSMLFVFDSKGTLVKQIIYGIKHNLKNKEPEVMEIK